MTMVMISWDNLCGRNENNIRERPDRSMVRTVACHAIDRGSIPLRAEM